MVADNLGDIRDVNIQDEMKSSYLDYAMSVIVSRALPGDRELKNFFERFKITARIIEVERKL